MSVKLSNSHYFTSVSSNAYCTTYMPCSTQLSILCHSPSTFTPPTYHTQHSCQSFITPPPQIHHLHTMLNTVVNPLSLRHHTYSTSTHTPPTYHAQHSCQPFITPPPHLLHLHTMLNTVANPQSLTLHTSSTYIPSSTRQLCPWIQIYVPSMCYGFPPTTPHQ